MYNDGSIIIRYYYNGDLLVEYANSMDKNIGKIQPSCHGYITFGNKQKEFKFNEKRKEIVWNGTDIEDKWIGGWFC